jgi:putative flavoprotein involved in K+ transport
MNTVVVGAGQAGLSVSYYLTRQRQEHVVLEQADAPADAWRNHRWDSFTLNTPNWQSQLPGAKHREVDPDVFMTCAEIVAYFEDYVRRFRLPVRYGTQVRCVERDAIRGKYYVTTSNGHEIVARNVVMATACTRSRRFRRSVSTFQFISSNFIPMTIVTRNSCSLARCWL